MIERSKEKFSDHPSQPREPLIRLRILYNEENQMFNYIRFGQQYNNRVANPMDMILFKKQVKRTKNEAKPFDQAAMDHVFEKVIEHIPCHCDSVIGISMPMFVCLFRWTSSTILASKTLLTGTSGKWTRTFAWRCFTRRALTSCAVDLSSTTMMMPRRTLLSKCFVLCVDVFF